MTDEFAVYYIGGKRNLCYRRSSYIDKSIAPPQQFYTTRMVPLHPLCNCRQGQYALTEDGYLIPMLQRVVGFKGDPKHIATFTFPGAKYRFDLSKCVIEREGTDERCKAHTANYDQVFMDMLQAGQVLYRKDLRADGYVMEPRNGYRYKDSYRPVRLTALDKNVAKLVSKGYPLEQALSMVYLEPKVIKDAMKRYHQDNQFYRYLFTELGFMNNLKELLERRGVDEESVADTLAGHILNRESKHHAFALKVALETLYGHKPNIVVQNVMVNNSQQQGQIANRPAISPDEIRAQLAGSVTLSPNQADGSEIRLLERSDVQTVP